MRLLPFHAIVHAELAHQRRQTPYRRWARIVAYVTIAASLLVAALLCSSEWLLALTFTTQPPEILLYQSSTWNLLNLLPVTVSVVLHFALLFQTISYAGNSIAREKRGNNWEMLLLTGVDSDQIVMGKWWATIKHMARMAMVLAALRALVIVWLGAAVTRLFTMQYANNPAALTPPTPWHFLLAGVAVIALTLANLGFTAACGIVASTGGRGGLLSFVGALGLRLVVLLVVSWMSATLLKGFISQNVAFRQFSDSAAMTPLDNGLSIGMGLARYHSLDTPDATLYLLVATLIALILYAFLTWLFLRFAQAQLVRQNVLPPLSQAAPESV